MSERDISRKIPQQRRTNLSDILTATAAESSARAKLLIGTNVHKRVAGYVRELNFLARDVLATKWGVDPRDIPIEIFPGESPLYPATSPTKTIQEMRESLITPHVQEVLARPQEDVLPNFRTSGDMLQYILGEARITQREIAALLGKSKSWVEKVGRTRPFKIGDVHQLCDMLELAEDHPYRTKLIQLVTEEARINARRAQIKGVAELDK